MRAAVNSGPMPTARARGRRRKTRAGSEEHHDLEAHAANGGLTEEREPQKTSVPRRRRSVGAAPISGASYNIV